MGAIYDSRDQSLSFKTSGDENYTVKAVASPGYTVTGWEETDASGGAGQPIPAEGVKMSSDKYFRPLVMMLSFGIEFSASPAEAGNIA